MIMIKNPPDMTLTINFIYFVTLQLLNEYQYYHLNYI
jgi:hypothetical protein